MNKNKQKKVHQRIDASKFEFVNQNYQIQSEQVFGKYSNFFVNILKRFFKKPASTIAFLVFLILILLMIIVPAQVTGEINQPISTNVFASNLRPRIPALGLDGTYWTLFNKEQLDTYGKVSGFIIQTGKATDGWTLTLINPYALPELKDFYPIFGTNAAAIDLWNLTWYGAASSMRLAAIVSLASVLIGLVYGSFSGWFAGKWIDLVMMRIVEIFDSVPTILWILVLVFVFKTGTTNTVGDAALIPSLILIYWTGSAIQARIFVLKTKDADFVQAAKSLGASVPRLLFSHILPTFVGRMVVRFVTLLSAVIFLESTLVFLGVKDLTEPTFGVIVFTSNEEAILKPYALWSIVIVVILLMLSTRFIALGLNDSIDQRNTKMSK